MENKSSIDKKFVLTALVIGAVYSTIVVLINKFIGKEAAGVAGVALTALGAAIFKQFETLRFKSDNEGLLTVSVPNRSFWQLIIFIFLLFGFQIFFEGLNDSILGFAYNYDLTAHIRNFFDIENSDDAELYTNVIVNGIAYFIGAFVFAKSIRVFKFSTIFIGSVFSIIIKFVNWHLPMVLIGDNNKESFLRILPYYKFSILLTAFSFIGAYAGQPKRI